MKQSTNIDKTDGKMLKPISVFKSAWNLGWKQPKTVRDITTKTKQKAKNKTKIKNQNKTKNCINRSSAKYVKESKTNTISRKLILSFQDGSGRICNSRYTLAYIFYNIRKSQIGYIEINDGILWIRK